MARSGGHPRSCGRMQHSESNRTRRACIWSVADIRWHKHQSEAEVTGLTGMSGHAWPDASGWDFLALDAYWSQPDAAQWWWDACLVTRWRLGRTQAEVCTGASGPSLNAVAGELDRWDRVDAVEQGWHVALIRRPDTGGVRPVIPNQQQWGAQRLYFMGLLFKLNGQLKLTLLAIYIDIATLWA
jgi:hypothetical protein